MEYRRTTRNRGPEGEMKDITANRIYDLVVPMFIGNEFLNKEAYLNHIKNILDKEMPNLKSFVTKHVRLLTEEIMEHRDEREGIKLWKIINGIVPLREFAVGTGQMVQEIINSEAYNRDTEGAQWEHRVLNNLFNKLAVIVGKYVTSLDGYEGFKNFVKNDLDLNVYSGQSGVPLDEYRKIENRILDYFRRY